MQRVFCPLRTIVRITPLLKGTYSPHYRHPQALCYFAKCLLGVTAFAGWLAGGEDIYTFLFTIFPLAIFSLHDCLEGVSLFATIFYGLLNS